MPLEGSHGPEQNTAAARAAAEGEWGNWSEDSDAAAAAAGADEFEFVDTRWRQIELVAFGERWQQRLQRLAAAVATMQQQQQE
jgi:hypothetical protein